MRIINKLIYGIGLFALVVSWVQWFFRYPDPSQLILGSGIGLSFLSFGYIYSWMIGKNEEIKKINLRLEGINKLILKGELE